MALKRALGGVELFAVATGAMISSGIFVLPGVAFGQVGPAVILSYVLAGLLALCGAITVAELASAMPKAGGDYFFITRGVGAFVGAVSGVLSWLALSSKSAFAIVGLSALVGVLTGLPPLPLGLAFAAVFVLVNLSGVRDSGRLQTALVFLLLGALGTMVVAGLPQVRLERFAPFVVEGIGSAGNSLDTAQGGFGGGLHQIVLTAGFVFVAYGGLLKAASVAGEVRNPGRTIPRALFASVIVVLLLYVLLLVVAVGVLDPQAFAGSTTPMADAAAAVLGTPGFLLITAAAVMAFITTANAGILAASRYPMALAHDGLMPSLFHRVHPRRGVPLGSILVTGLLIVLFLLLELSALVKAASTFLIVNYFLSHLSLVLLRVSGVQNYRPGFRSPLFPWVQLVGMGASVILLVDLGLVTGAIGVGAVLLGALLYALSGHAARGRESALLHLIARITDRSLQSRNLERELREALHERDGVAYDEIDALFSGALILDRPGPEGAPELFETLGRELAPRLGLDAAHVTELLAKREAESSTAISHFVAVPHLVSDDLSGLELAVARVRSGCSFEGAEGVRCVFVLAGPRNLRNMHLKTLSALAQIVQEEEFERHWLAAADTEALRDVLLLGRRLRGPAAGPGPGETLASTVAASNHTNGSTSGSERRYQ